MDFDLDAGEQRVIKDLRGFVESEVLPLTEKYQDLVAHESRVIREDGTLKPELVDASRELRRRSAKAGFYALHMPEDAGGGGMSRAGTLMANKAVFEHGLGFTLAVLASIEGPNRMLLALPEDQRKRYLDPLVRGEKTSAFALTEPGAGSDARNLETRAVKDGNEWVINGTKWFITNGPYADFVQVFARTGDDGGLGDITAFLVDADTPGFRVGRTFETIANNGLPCELVFEDCRVPEENVIGGVGEGFFHALGNITDIRIQIGGMSLGLAKYCLDTAVDHVTTRKAFGKPVSKFQGVSFPLADSFTELTAAEALALYTAWKIDRDGDAMTETSMTKLYTTEMLWNVADRCLGAMGGVGTLRETGIERILRWARVMRVFEGTNEIQRNTIAKGMGL